MAAAAGLVGCEVPRVWTPPLRPLTPETSAGFECCTFAEDVLNLRLHPWQRWLLINALELLEDGSFRFRTVLVLVARQNGKSTLLQVLALWRMYVDGAPLVIGTAQNLDVAEEQWQGAVDRAEDVPELAAEIAQVSKVNGKKSLRLTGGERYKIAAASRRGGRGLTGDLVLLDELREHAHWDAWGAVTKTTMARARAQVWAASNAGDRASVVLAHLRLAAHVELGNPDGLDAGLLGGEVEEGAGDWADDALGIFEWSAEPGGSKWDRDRWCQANPSLGHPEGVSARAVAAAARTDPDDVFRPEVMCQWVDQVVRDPDLDVARWVELSDPSAERGERPVFGVDVGVDRLAHVAVAWRRADGGVQVMLADVDVAPSVTARRVAELARRWDAPVMVGGPSAYLDGELPAGVVVRVVSSVEFATGVGRLVGLVADGGVRHGGQERLDQAVAGARLRPFGGSGERTLVLRDAPEAGPLAAAVRAVHGVLAGAGAAVLTPTLASTPSVASVSSPLRGGVSDVATMGF